MASVQHFQSANKRINMNTVDLSNVTHHPVIEEVVDVLCNKTQNTDKNFFRTEVAYFLGKMASCMRASIVTKDRGEIPINIYALALATSGFGKGYSVSIMENEFIKAFKDRFMSETMPIIAEQHMWDLANDKAAKNGTDPQEEFDKYNSDYKRYGAFAFTFDSATVPAVKQLRQRLILGNVGAINLQIDEIGSNLINSNEVLTTFLELYDQGTVKQKLTKNTAENTRSEEIDGKTPTNALLFGTPNKLLDGGQTEAHFYDNFLDTGYARRCLFGYGEHSRKSWHTMSPTEVFQKLTQTSNTAVIQKWAALFHDLADPTMFGWKCYVADDVAIKLLEYKIQCEQHADTLADHEEIKKSELSHRYFKALKLAGAFAFVDKSPDVTMDHLLQAILLVEESGIAFDRVLTREKAYVKLAKYIANINAEVTHADLLEALPFYKSSVAARNEMMTLATAWGYKQHIIIKKSFIDGIEFFRGETLKKTNIDEIMLSYSDHFAYSYQKDVAPFTELHKLTQAEGMHWCNHSFKNEHRSEENVIAGFNMIVIDVDGGVSLNAVHELLKDYVYMTYTTKRHTDTENRFRIMIPTNYVLHLDAADYKEFMDNIAKWLPFKIDEEANQRSRKWETYHKGNHHYNLEGELLDVLPFIPKTSKNESYKQDMQKIESMDNLERWFAQRIANGNRNNQMLKYALTLVDSGMNLFDVQNNVYAFNDKLNKPLDRAELDSTVLKTAASRIVNQ